MLSTSPDLSPRQTWQAERRAAVLARFDARIPPRYRRAIELPAPVQEWATAGPAAGAGLFLTGAIGVGKTHTAWMAARTWLAAAVDATDRGTPVVTWWRSTALFDALRPEGDNPRGVTADCQTAGLLVLDDLAAARVSPSGWTQERLYELFDERYTQQRPVLITSDVLPIDLGPVVGPRVSSRLAEMCAGGVHRMQGEDRRRGGAR